MRQFFKLLRDPFVRLLMSLSSFSGVIYFYIVARQDVPFVSANTDILFDDPTINFAVKNGIYAAGFIGMSLLTLALVPKSFKGGETMKAKETRPIESVAVPTYIGMFVIAVEIAGIDNAVAGYIILVALFLFWRRIERIFYFNPVWLIFGYRFYEVKTEDGNAYTLITKRSRLKGGYEFEELNRINNYTFFERKSK